MKKVLFSIVLSIVISLSLCICTHGVSVYEFELENGAEQVAEDSLSKLLDSIPEEIRDELPEGGDGTSFESFDVDYFVSQIMDAVKEAISPALNTVSGLLGIVILGAVFEIFAKTVVGGGISQVFSFCASLCVALFVFSSMETVFGVVEAFLKTLSDTMLAMIPAMEAIYISSGNLTTSAVSSTGINIMIGLTQQLFSKVLEPCVYTLYILSVTAAVTKNGGIAFMQRTLRGMLTGAIIIIMTVVSFVLALQTAGASAADNLATRTIKFAIGTYLPIVGGSVADSFSLLSGSLGVIKQACGITGIAVIIVAFLPPFAIILLNRLAVGLSGAVASSLGCERESVLLEECKGICTLLLAVAAGAAVMYMIALGIFCRTPIAVN